MNYNFTPFSPACFVVAISKAICKQQILPSYINGSRFVGLHVTSCSILDTIRTTPLHIQAWFLNAVAQIEIIIILVIIKNNDFDRIY